MSAPSSRGRRLVPTEAAAPSVLPDELEQDQLAGEPEDEQEHYRLLYPGAEIEASVTLAVDFGDGKTNFIKYGAKDVVQENEDHSDVYLRLGTVVVEGASALVVDTQERLHELEGAVRARRAAMERQTSGR